MVWWRGVRTRLLRVAQAYRRGVDAVTHWCGQLERFRQETGSTG
jgi:hypothetical protein